MGFRFTNGIHNQFVVAVESDPLRQEEAACSGNIGNLKGAATLFSPAFLAIAIRAGCEWLMFRIGGCIAARNRRDIVILAAK